ncbi:MAG: alpha/beta hydrolase [Bacteroidota bacterium]
MKSSLKIIILCCICLTCFNLNGWAQVPEGAYEGHIVFSLGELGIVVNFKKTHDSLTATIDIPMQGAKGKPLSNVKFNDPNIYFELPAGPGLAKFDGKIKQDSIVGAFTQAAVVGTFNLVKLKPEDTITPSKPKLPFKEESVKFTNGENTFGGTLTIPDKPGKHPAVIMITGSGAQNRDEEILGFKPFKIIAEHMGRCEIAVLRYDDRGVGESKGKTVNESTTLDFATDVEQAIKYLKTRPDIDTTKIGLMGHSEGGIIAPIVASRNKDVAFIVLMAGSGVKGEDVMNEQKRLIMKKAGSSDEEITKSLKLSEQVFTAIRKNKGMDAVKKELKKQVLEMAAKDTAKKKKTPEEEAQLDQMLDAQLKAYQSVWMKCFIDLDPRPYLEKTTCPALVLFGELDVQVPPKQNEKPIADALKKAGNKDVRISVFPKTNHLFQEAKTGNIDEYAMLNKEFVPGFLVMVSEWIRKHCNQ